MKWGSNQLVDWPSAASGEWVSREGESWYCINDFDAMPPFLMSVVSGSDHWLYISSNGSLSCGRRDAEGALFPYCTDDRIHDGHHHTGPVTLVRVQAPGQEPSLWMPFQQGPRVYRLRRRLLKNTRGDRLVFEEHNEDLGLTFSQQWCSSVRYGFVRSCRLENESGQDLHIALLDGARNFLPAGVEPAVQTSLSTLMDAYKQSEAVMDLPMALFTLSSLLTDRAEPAESLQASTAWSLGLPEPRVVLTEEALRPFMAGSDPAAESFVRGRRCHFLIHSDFSLQTGERQDWLMVADSGLDASDVTALCKELHGGLDQQAVLDDVQANSDILLARVRDADGIQDSADALQDARHFANTLFNIMRGGLPADGYRLRKTDFLAFVANWNRPLLEPLAACIESLEDAFDREQLLSALEASGDADMQRLGLEFLPLVFSRRHGDPSRPWNRFTIDLKNLDGSDKIHYEGNWRDIFQNWEALCVSFPGFIDGMLARFVNASTADGYNPYRISADGIDWEVLDPDDPWSNIGYWGDHQVNYLVRLVEIFHSVAPGRLQDFLGRGLFVYADVPYRIRPFNDLVRDPRNSIEFSEESAERSASRVAMLGADGRLLTAPNGSIHHVNLWEKLLLSALARIGSLVPGGGIWMNTQRPEWNDANNALAGYGLSVVTMCYLRRFLVVLESLLSETEGQAIFLSVEVADYLRDVFSGLQTISEDLDALDDDARGRFLLVMGAANDRFRARIDSGFSGEVSELSADGLAQFLATSRRVIEHSISVNKRNDGLYHAYNLLRMEGEAAAVDTLYPMLEGQVAALSSGMLGPAECLALLQAVRGSDLYSPDKNSYLLYPDRKLPNFLEKNALELKNLSESGWLLRESESGSGRFIRQDQQGTYHFNSRFHNAEALAEAMRSECHASEEDVKQACAVYESVFNHHEFTGRSGAMYKYEGLGSIYWHMVSKLLLATAEAVELARAEGADQATRHSLADCYREIKQGIGLHSGPAAYGAFPTDPYSHTPSFMGAQQPGMTGQVKEDVLSRFYELGVQLKNGCLVFDPCLLAQSDFDSDTGIQFTLCGTPVHYHLSDQPGMVVRMEDQRELTQKDYSLSEDLTRSVLQRAGSVAGLSVGVARSGLF